MCVCVSVVYEAQEAFGAYRTRRISAHTGSHLVFYTACSARSYGHRNSSQRADDDDGVDASTGCPGARNKTFSNYFLFGCCRAVSIAVICRTVVVWLMLWSLGRARARWCCSTTYGFNLATRLAPSSRAMQHPSDEWILYMVVGGPPPVRQCSANSDRSAPAAGRRDAHHHEATSCLANHADRART